jgi:hypothetical protein
MRPDIGACIAIEPRMNSSHSLKLTQSNAAALARYAELVGVSPETFLNAFLQEFLVAHI